MRYILTTFDKEKNQIDEVEGFYTEEDAKDWVQHINEPIDIIWTRKKAETEGFIYQVWCV